jgi:hypothetical protein
MPTVASREQKIYMHCINPRCRGMMEEEVDGLAEETSYLFTDNGGDIPGVERSVVVAKPVHEEDETCPHCGGRRDASLSPRPQYQRLSGHDPMGLLNVPSFDPNKVNTPTDERDAELDALKQRLAALEARDEQPGTEVDD